MTGGELYESCGLDKEWMERASRKVGEPEEEEEVAARMEELRTLILEAFQEPVSEELLSEANLKRWETKCCQISNLS